MPTITFEAMSGIPSISLLPTDYFSSSSPPDLPEMPEIPESEFSNAGDIQRRAKEAVDSVFGNVKDMTYAPTPLDINGFEIGRQVALATQRYNRHAGIYRQSLMDICLKLFDGREDFNPGFMDVYNSIVESYAKTLYFTVPGFLAGNPLAQREALYRLYRMHWSHCNGLLRGTQTALRTAYGVAITHSDLDVGHVQTITRPGKVPADFAGDY